MKWMRERLVHKDEGFTLIELMVVVLIIAILIAIAIPSFLGFRRNAQDRSAQSDVRNVLLAEQAYYTENTEYTADEALLQAIEPNVTLDAADPKAAVVAELNGTDIVCLTRESDAGNVFAVFISSSEGTLYGKSDLVGANCPANAAGLGATFGVDGWD